MKSLSTLIKLQKNYVNDQRLMVAMLQEQLAGIENDIQLFHEQQAQQRVLVTQHPEMALTYGEYLQQCVIKEELLQKKRRTAELALGYARDKLAELFEGQKRYELAEQARLEEEARVEAQKETQRLDEIGSVSFVRKKKKR